MKQTVYFQSSESMFRLKDETVDFIITSPPYWNLKDYGNLSQIGQSSYEEYIERLNLVWQECFRVAKPNTLLVVNVNTRRHKKKFYPIPFDIVSNMKNWFLWDHVIWNIPNALPQSNFYMEKLLDNKFESLLIFLKGDPNLYHFSKPRVPQKYDDPRPGKQNLRGRCLGNIVRIPAYRPPNVKEMSYHCAAFPEELVSFFLECYTKKGDIVLDPFCGSGTTLKVAKSMKRLGIGFEINKLYKSLIIKKIKEKFVVPAWKTIDLIHSIRN